MELEHKKITFRIANSAYTVDIGSDLNDDIINGIKKFLQIDKHITIEELLSAYLRKNIDFIDFENSVKNSITTLNDFNDKIV
jgi:CRISPR/Cas system-associated endoribonuclease Cas2